jgi:hypothetical protein
MSERPQVEPPAAGRWMWPAVITCLAAGALIRVWAALGDFVLDEIWSLSLAQWISSPWDVFTLPQANSHPLNTLFAYFLGDRNVHGLRLPSVLSGIAALGLLARAAARRDPVEMLTTLWLCSVSYLLVLYSAEARGYAMAILFGICAFLALRSHLESRTPGARGVFWVSVVLGLTAQLSFVTVFLSLVVWGVYHELRARGPRGRTWMELAGIHGIPLAFAGTLYLSYARQLVFSGDVMSLRRALAGVVTLAVGIDPEWAGGAVPAVVVAAALAVSGIVLLARERSSEWMFYVCVLLPAPALVALASRTGYMYPRSFVVCVPFFYLLAGRVLAACFRRSIPGKAVAAVALLLFTAGSAHLDRQLISPGRGSYHRALFYMAQETAGPEVVVASDHDFRNKLMLYFYARYLPPSKRLVYVEHKDIVPGNGPEWLIMHSTDLKYVPRPEVDARGGKYGLVRSYPYGGISGFSWFVYRRATPAP